MACDEQDSSAMTSERLQHRQAKQSPQRRASANERVNMNSARRHNNNKVGSATSRVSSRSSVSSCSSSSASSSLSFCQPDKNDSSLSCSFDSADLAALSTPASCKIGHRNDDSVAPSAAPTTAITTSARQLRPSKRIFQILYYEMTAVIHQKYKMSCILTQKRTETEKSIF
ncbi:hypothetical protein TKK_0012903 [Trichogramma kaykai]